MNRFRFQPVGALAASVAAAATFAPAAQADFTTRRWTSDTNFELVISHMPDFDQQRSGLGACGSGTPGANFCVPTSTANLFAYIAQHGDTSVSPGDHNWISSTNYTTATNFISTLASKMSTSDCNGTSNSDAYKGAKDLMRSEAGSDFVVEHESWSIFNVVTLKEMTRESVDNKAIQEFAYGKYETLGTNACGETVINRKGGHAMTFVGALRSGTTRKISYHDPDDDTNTASQSAFVTSEKDCPWMTDLVVFSSVTGSCWGFNQSMNWVKRSTGDEYMRLLDSRISIRPASSHSWGSYTGLVGGVSVATVAGTFVPGELEHLSASAQGVSLDANAKPSLAVSPSGIPFLLVPGVAGGLFVEQRNDAGSTLVPVSLANAGLPATPISAIAFNGDRTLMAVCGRTVYAIAGLDGGKPSADEAQPAVVWQQQVPFDIAAIVPMPADASESGIRSLVVSADLHSIMSIGGDPAIQPTMRAVPQQLQFDLDRVNATTIVADRMGTLWFAQSGDQHLKALTPNGNFFITPLAVANITGLAIDDLDNLLVVDNGTVRCFSMGPTGVSETGLQRSKFAGQVVGNGFTVCRSSSNYEPRFHGGAGWRSVPDPIAAPNVCLGDIDGNGSVDGSDMATLLGSWNSVQNAAADLDHDGIVAGSDLAILLTSWGVCH